MLNVLLFSFPVEMTTESDLSNRRQIWTAGRSGVTMHSVVEAERNLSYLNQARYWKIMGSNPTLAVVC